MDDGWSLKHLHRLIVTSATYRQSSKVTPELLAKDPVQPAARARAAVRVDAEVVRDIALAASGLLNPKLGGPSVYPPAPDFLFEPPVELRAEVWHEAKAATRPLPAGALHLPLPLGALPGAPDLRRARRATSPACGARARTRRCRRSRRSTSRSSWRRRARWRASALEAEGGATSAAPRYAFRRVLAREPTPAEAGELLKLVRSAAAALRRTASSTPGTWRRTTRTSPWRCRRASRMEELAAWTAASRALLNLDETITNQ